MPQNITTDIYSTIPPEKSGLNVIAADLRSCFAKAKPTALNYRIRARESLLIPGEEISSKTEEYGRIREIEHATVPGYHRPPVLSPPSST